MYSMTGYGKGQAREEGLELTVEIKSVNNRFLDLSVKSPRAFLAQEEFIRAAVRNAISRGHVDLYVSYQDRRDRKKTLSLDCNLARSYVTAAQELKAAFPDLKDDLNVTSVLRLPDVLCPETVDGADETLVNALKTALETALKSHREMRKAEGERMGADIVSRMETIAALRDDIAKRAPLIAEEYRKKLTDRITEYLGGKVEETRILTEAALFADKCNIDEELTRLSSHIKEFYSIIKHDAVGRKLDFLIQEFNRECNTICSKSNDAEITKSALAMKNEIEKVREQVQNLE